MAVSSVCSIRKKRREQMVLNKYIKIVAAVVLSLLVMFEIGYIVKLNLPSKEKSIRTQEQEVEVEVTPIPSKLPVVTGPTAEPQSDPTQQVEPTPVPSSKGIIVIDPGHGKSSSLMSADEKRASGWVQNSSGAWGEWRHYKKGSSTVNCEGSGCNGRVTPNGACWYPIGNSDRNVEPDINLQNALAAKRHLEAMGYTVRMTRTTSDENPSITRRLSYCHPNNDTTKPPDADAFICIHSNASGGGARGTAYITAEDPYDQAWINSSYTADSNTLGKLCNDYIAQMTSLSMSGNGAIAWEPELIAFCKSPVPCAYLEVGFFDNASDLNILKTESDKIGEAITKGVDEFCRTH